MLKVKMGWNKERVWSFCITIVLTLIMLLGWSVGKLAWWWIFVPFVANAVTFFIGWVFVSWMMGI